MQKGTENRPEPSVPEQARLFTHDPENSILVENSADGVTISAARDNFCRRKRFYFIRYLASEGYIPSRFEQLCEQGPDALSRIRWLVDPSRFMPAEPVQKQTNRFMLCLIIGGSLLWFSLMTLAFLHVL